METKGEKIENFRHSQQILWRMALENLNGFKWKENVAGNGHI